MTLQKSADKLRRAAERAGRDGNNERRRSDSESAAVNGELSRPDESKGRPRPNGQPSNAGRDGP